MMISGAGSVLDFANAAANSQHEPEPERDVCDHGFNRRPGFRVHHEGRRVRRHLVTFRSRQSGLSVLPGRIAGRRPAARPSTASPRRRCRPASFDPGSDPFEGTVALGGTGSGPYGTDTTVQRHGPLDFPTVPSTDMVDIELIALNLVSCAPITVTYNGGQNPQQWDVSVGLSSALSPWGQMTATMTTANGGTFDATFNVQPLFYLHRGGQSGPRAHAGYGGDARHADSVDFHRRPWRTTPRPQLAPPIFPGNRGSGRSSRAASRRAILRFRRPTSCTACGHRNAHPVKAAAASRTAPATKPAMRATAPV